MASAAAAGVVVTAARAPALRDRGAATGHMNQPERRRARVLAQLQADRATIELVAERPGALDLCAAEGALTAAKLDFFRAAYAARRARTAFSDPVFSSAEVEGGLVPYFFTRTRATPTDAMERRLAWHAVAPGGEAILTRPVYLLRRTTTEMYRVVHKRLYRRGLGTRRTRRRRSVRTRWRCWRTMPRSARARRSSPRPARRATPS
jgi:hypothetical protein